MTVQTALEFPNNSHVIHIDRFGAFMGVDSATRFSQVPDGDQMQVLACHMRARLSAALSDCSAAAMAETMGWRFRARRLGGDGGSTVQSLLVPLNTGGFSIVVNTQHVTTELETLWLAAHELGHSFFYADGIPPRRIIPGSEAEERFCDDFADELLLDLGARRTLRVA